MTTRPSRRNTARASHLDMPRSPTAPADSISAWLDRLVALLRLSPTESAEIRDELESHLRERVRDLMLVGTEEPVAIHQAISELGDLALLAQRLREAHRPTRRSIAMHTLALAIPAGVIALAALTWPAARPVTPAAQPPPPTNGSTGSAAFAESRQPDTRVVAALSAATVDALARALAHAHDAPLYVHWKALEPFGLAPDTVIGDLPPVPAHRLLDLASDQLDLPDGVRLDYRFDGRLFELATRDYFDRRERQLITYDIAPLVPSVGPLDITRESLVLVELLITIIEPDAWSEHGGELASVYATGTRLFVSAPPRIQQRVDWVLRQLATHPMHARPHHDAPAHNDAHAPAHVDAPAPVDAPPPSAGAAAPPAPALPASPAPDAADRP